MGVWFAVFFPLVTKACRFGISVRGMELAHGFFGDTSMREVIVQGRHEDVLEDPWGKGGTALIFAEWSKVVGAREVRGLGCPVSQKFVDIPPLKLEGLLPEH